MLSAAQQTVAEQLFDINAIKFGAFRMKLHDTNPDAPLSPIYVDLRILRSFPKAMDAAIVLYIDMVKNLSFDILADVPTAATPIVARAATPCSISRKAAENALAAPIPEQIQIRRVPSSRSL